MLLSRVLRRSRKVADKIRREYVLPNGSTVIDGFVRSSTSAPPTPGEQVLSLCNERFAVPEVLFSPSDVGLQQMGVAEAIAVRPAEGGRQGHGTARCGSAWEAHGLLAL